MVDWREWSQHVLAELKRLDETQKRSCDYLYKIDERLDRSNETLIRNTVTLEEHVKRTNLLESKLGHVETEVDGLKDHMTQIHWITSLITPTKLGAAVLGILTFMATLFGIIELLKK